MKQGRRFLPVLAMALSGVVLSTTTALAATKITIWDYVDWRINFYRSYAEEYRKLNPNVEFDLQVVPLNEYVDKIKVGIAAGIPPTMFSFHPTFVSSFKGLLQPFPEDLFPPAKLSRELLGFSGVLQDGKMYHYPLGVQGGLLFINQDLWDAAGLADPPKTWEEAKQIGLRATRRSGNTTEIAGFFFNDEEMMNDMFIDLNYQYGGNIWLDKGKRVGFSEPSAINALKLIVDLYDSGVSGWAGEPVNFLDGKSVMRYGWAWRQQQLALRPELRWTVAPIPTLTGKLTPGSQRMDFYLGMAVPVGVNSQVAREAFKFLQWAYEDNKRLMELNSRSGTLAARRTLWGDRDIVQNPVLYTLTQTLPYATFPGEYPGWIKTELQKVATATRQRSADPVVVLQEVTRQINVRLQTEPPAWVAE